MKKLILGTAFALSATGAIAQSGPDVSFDGSIRYGIVTDFDFSNDYVDLDLRLEGQFAGSSGLGFFLGYEALAEVDDLGDPIDLFLYGLTYDFGPGKLRFGRPNSVVADLLDGRYYGVGVETGLQLEPLIGSFVKAGMRQETDLLGVSYDGNYGNIDTGLSLHYSLDADEFALGGYLSYAAGNFKPFIAFETASDLAGGDPRYVLGTDINYGRVNGQVAYNINGGFQPDLNSLVLTGDYQVNDNFEAGLSIIHVSTAMDSDTLYGVGGKYSFDTGVFVRADLAETFGAADTLFTFEVGYDF